MQLGQDYFTYNLKKDLPLAFFFQLNTMPSKAGKDLLFEQILLSDLGFDTYELVKAKEQSFY